MVMMSSLICHNRNSASNGRWSEGQRELGILPTLAICPAVGRSSRPSSLRLPSRLPSEEA